MAKGKKILGSVRAKAGQPAKAGRRRPHNMISVMDEKGKRNWEFSAMKSGNNNVKVKPDFGIRKKEKTDFDIYDQTSQRDADRKLNLYFLNNPANKQAIQKCKEKISEIANSIYKSDPFYFGKVWKDFKMGWISKDEVMQGRI